MDMTEEQKAKLKELREKDQATLTETEKTLMASLVALEAAEKAAAGGDDTGDGITLDEVGKTIKTAVTEGLKGLADILKAQAPPGAPAGPKKEKTSFAEILAGIKIMAKHPGSKKGQYIVDKYKMIPEKKYAESIGEGAEEKDLNEGTDSAGGYLVPLEQSNQIINQIKEQSVIRNLARHWPMKHLQLSVPVVTSGTTAYWIDEHGQKTKSEPTFDQLLLTAYKLINLTVVSDELLEDADPSVEPILYDLFTKSTIRAEETAFLQGAAGGGDPLRGVYNTVGITTVPYSGDILVDLNTALGAVETNEGVDQKILHSLREIQKLRGMKDDNGAYVYMKPTDPNMPPTIWGYGAHADKYIPTNLGVATNQSYMITGDWNHAHVGDRKGMVIAMDQGGKYFEYDQTAFRTVRRVAWAIDKPLAFSRITGITLN